MTRRHFAGLCATLGLLPLAPLSNAMGASAFLSAYRDQDGRFGVAALDDSGTVLFTERLPARGHDTVHAPDKRTAVTFARRPGRFALAFDLERKRPGLAFEAPPDRHFFGHGFFSPDGNLLYATENAYDEERGVLGVYDTQAGYRRIGEFDTHGIGPHEALLLRDGRTIAVANGGILTHPDHPRWKLNLATMAPSIAYLDRETGDLLELVALPARLHQLSIRHIDQAGDGALWFGGQYEGAATDEVGLVGRHRRGRNIELFELPDAARRSLRHYVGSVKASLDGRRIALTSPRGGICLTLDAASGHVLDTKTLADVCGVAPTGPGFALTTGQGSFMINQETASPVAWDNHLRAIAF